MKKFFFPIFLLAAISCHESVSNSKAAGSEKIRLEDQGVNMDYTDSGLGDTTLLFVHSWGINRTYWADQYSYFSKKYRVVTIDLPGFGNSGKNRSSWSVKDYARDIATVIRGLDLKNVILIGHSMSGAIVVQAALDSPAMVRGIIGIDNFKDFGTAETPEAKEENKKFFAAARSHYTATITPFLNKVLFSASTDSAIRTRVVQDILRSDSVIALACLEQSGISNEKVISLKRPLYLLNSDYTPTDTASLKKDHVEFHLLTIHGTGHYPMIEKPGEFNELLDQAIRMILEGK
jgi:pimeloyl-ACP methyl ester carboxylesterase